MARLEKDIEKEIVQYIEKEMRGEALKLKLDGRRGFPDRTFLLPGGWIMFVELKKPGGKLRPQQVWWLSRLKELGFEATVCHSLEEVKNFISWGPNEN